MKKKLTGVELVEAMRKEMIGRKTRHYKRKVLKECVMGIATFIAVVSFLLLAMAVFPN